MDTSVHTTVATVRSRPRSRRLTAAQRAERLANPAFGSVFTEHMVSARWTPERGWFDIELTPYGPLQMDPAMAGLHYGQVVFEGLKAFRDTQGAITLFRPDAHARRMRDSARRLRMPEPPVPLFLDAVTELARHDGDWLSDDPSISLYLRPILFASEPQLALRPAREYRLLVIAFVTEGFFGRDPRAVTVWLTDKYSRAAPGGTGAVKYAGNYAGTYLAQEQAAAHGCDQVVWLDAAQHSRIEEMGGMNLFFVYEPNRLVTPPLSGTILPGVTRDSVLALAAELDLEPVEQPLTVQQWREDCANGSLTEVFACGTAAGVSAVGEVRSAAGSWQIGDGRPGEVTVRVQRQLTAVQRGELPDCRGWLHPVA